MIVYIPKKTKKGACLAASSLSVPFKEFE